MGVRSSAFALISFALFTPPLFSGESAGGRQLSNVAFASNRSGNFEVYVMNADGSGQRRLTRNPEDDILPAWSPVTR